MKQVFTKTLLLSAMLLAFAMPRSLQESKRGIFNGDLPGGGKIVFFVEGNNALSAYVFDNSGNRSPSAAPPLTRMALSRSPRARARRSPARYAAPC